MPRQGETIIISVIDFGFIERGLNLIIGKLAKLLRSEIL
jgi:hypothetical protein